ncbi:MAG: B12-binding domain-containing radical SAM protein [Polyangia bacterium]
MHKFHLFGRTRSAREAPLSISVLAALTADQPDVEYTCVDESVDPVPIDARPDLVGISVLTGTARRCYALASHFRAHGVPVVLGGAHVTILPDEARRFADSIVIGMAEKTWPQLIRDFKNGALKPEYREPPPSSEWATDIPVPRWELLREDGYMVPYTVHATRGCVHTCDFCSVGAIWKRYQRRPVADVIRDIRAIPRRRFALNDVSPFEDREYTKELLTAMIPLRKTWGGLATTRIVDDPEVLELLRRSGCRFLLIGFESSNQRTLNTIHKGFNRGASYHDVMRKLHGAGIVVQGCFVLGFDGDDTDCFRRTVDLVQELRIDIPRYSIYTPYPGTPLFARLEKEQRILSYDWADYDTMHVVIQPARMTPVELYEGFRWTYRETFKLKNILQRTLAVGRNFPIAFAGNLTYRLYVQRLQRTRGFEQPLLRPTTNFNLAAALVHRRAPEARAPLAAPALPGKV